MTTAPSRTVPVVAEWALWGKEDRDDQDYHLLRCSTGDVGRRVFSRQLARYSPGDLNQLPQVSVNWIKGGADGHASHLAIVFHETSLNDPPDAPARGRRDAAGRDIVFARYFCVRYEGLARQHLSFEALYNGFLEEMLPEPRDLAINRELPIESPQADHEARGIAQLIAAQLLTTRPVCITGAGQLSVLDRLRVIDQVMAELPYGMRNCLSASTWVNSSHRQHRFRLFFAASPRSGESVRYDDREDDDFGSKAPEDIVLDLAQLAQLAQSGQLSQLRVNDVVADPNARLYLGWARDAAPRAIAQLAAQTDPVHLGKSEEIGPAVRKLPSRLATTIQGILELIKDALRGGDVAELREVVPQLERQLADQNVPIDRGQCREFIKSQGMLRDNGTRIPGALQNNLFSALIKAAVGTPLTTRGYRDVVDCAGLPMHEPLGRAMTAHLVPGTVPWILVNDRLQAGEDKLFGYLSQQGHPPERPLGDLMADVLDAGDISRQDCKVVCDFGLRYLLAFGSDPRATIRGLHYLIPVIEYIYPQWQSDQVDMLRAILNDAYGARLGRADIREILTEPGTRRSVVLASAVYTMTRWKRYVKKAYFDVSTEGVIPGQLRQLPASRRRPGTRRRVSALIPGRARSWRPPPRGDRPALVASPGSGEPRPARAYMSSDFRPVLFVLGLLVVFVLVGIAGAELLVHH